MKEPGTVRDSNTPAGLEILTLNGTNGMGPNSSLMNRMQLHSKICGPMIFSQLFCLDRRE
jgi:hypothetical protein